MLQTIRDKSSGWLAIVVLGLIILTMAFFGVESYFAPKVETYTARIEGPAKFLGFGGQHKDIEQNEFRRRFDQLRAEQRSQQGDAFDALKFESAENKRTLLDRMIDEEIAMLSAQRDGISASKAEVQKAILEIDAFKVDGTFSADQYRLALQSQGYTTASFEQLVSNGLIRSKLSEEIASSAFSSDDEVDDFAHLSQQTRDLIWLELPTPSLPAEPPSDKELRDWYQSNASRYQREENVAIEYVEVDAAAIPKIESVDEVTLRERYEQQKGRYVTEPQYLASHLLVNVPPDADKAVESAARDRAAALVAKARADGADFAALAKENSDDLGSKAEGGDLGAIEKGVFDPAFEQAVFALQAGQVSEPVRGPDGWHVIKLREIVPGVSRSFEDVHDELMAEVLESEHERAFSELSGRLVDLVYKDPSALAPAAQELGLPLLTAPAFTRNNGDGITALPAIRKAAFADPQKLERLVSDAIEVAPGHVVMLRVTDHQPAVTRPFEEVRDTVLADFNTDRLGKLAKEQAIALRERANKGESLDALAAELGRSVMTRAGVARRVRDLPPTVVQEAFLLDHPKEGASRLAAARIDNDRYALVGITGVTDGDVNKIDEAMRALIRKQLAQGRGAVEARAYLEALRKEYTITVAEDRL